MARPKAGDKRTAILNAAAIAIATDGIGASTSKIARRAGVADGTIFIYFATKDELLEQLFIEIKRDLYQVIGDAFPHQSAADVQALHFWNRYLDWGLANTQKRRALEQLAVSDRIGQGIREQTERDSLGCRDVLTKHLAAGSLSKVSPTFAVAIMSALAEATLEFIVKEPESEEDLRNAGFAAFWRATGA